MRLYYISVNNSKNTNYSHISLPGTDLFKYLVLKAQPLGLFNISENLQENKSLKVLYLKDCAFLFGKPVSVL